MKVALITGASGAIGQAIALELASIGFSLYLHYNSNSSSCEALAEQLSVAYPNQFFRTMKANFFDKEETTQFIKALPKDEIALIIHNSGHSLIKQFQDVSELEFDQLIQHHVKVPFLLTQALLPYMVRNKKGHILFISSIWGQTGASMETIYSMVKGAQISLSKALAKELGPSHISVNAIAPGAVQTPMMQDFDEASLEALAEEIPMGRLAEPKEIASLVGYLCRAEASYITGQVLGVNGGWYC